MATADQNLARWAPKPCQRATKISAQSLRERNVIAQSTRKARSQRKVLKTLGDEVALTDKPRDAQIKRPQRPAGGEKEYCTYRHPAYRKNLKIITEGRPCSCIQRHTPTFAHEWKDTPAEAPWDYKLPNGGNQKRKKKVAFNEKYLNEVYEVDRWFESEYINSNKYWSSGPPGLSTDKSTTEEDDADIVCQELEEIFIGFSLVDVGTDPEEVDDVPSTIEDDCSWLVL